jgi:hypothetical protein
MYIFENNEYSSIESVLEVALPLNRTDNEGRTKPMRAQPYYKTKTIDVKLIKTNIPTIKFPCYGQPKLNGFRVMARWETVKEGEGLFIQEVEKVVFRSKEGLRYDILEHIEAEFTKDMFFLEMTDKDREQVEPLELVFDGEMYIHGEILSEISSAVRKRNNKTCLLEFRIFDLAIEGVKQTARLEMLSNILINSKPHILRVPHIRIESNERAQIFTDKCIAQGYEGAIFRDKTAMYAFGKRPQTMTKLKRSEDKEFKIVDVVGGDNSPELGVFVCIAENGKTFKCTPEGTQEQKREYLSNKSKYIGKNLIVKFFERTKDDLPFHAIGITIRDYE